MFVSVVKCHHCHGLFVFTSSGGMSSNVVIGKDNKEVWVCDKCLKDSDACETCIKIMEDK